jgi:hypothetical protein
MLGVGNDKTIDSQWELLDSRAVLPVEYEEYFDKVGPKQDVKQRDYERHYLRCRAILRHDNQTHAIYMKDCSRSGMGFVSPVQFFPRQRVQVFLDTGRSYLLEITRCRRLKTNCYVCGSIFVLGS